MDRCLACRGVVAPHRSADPCSRRAWSVETSRSARSAMRSPGRPLGKGVCSFCWVSRGSASHGWHRRRRPPPKPTRCLSFAAERCLPQPRSRTGRSPRRCARPYAAVWCPTHPSCALSDPFSAGLFPSGAGPRLGWPTRCWRSQRRCCVSCVSRRIREDASSCSKTCIGPTPKRSGSSSTSLTTEVVIKRSRRHQAPSPRPGAG